VVAALAGVPLLSAVDPLVPATVALAAFAISGVAQLWLDRRAARRAFRGH
jgi:membrane protein implicated in regulation of membrane protease activity